MDIRQLAEADIPQITRLGRLMHDESQYSYLHFSPDKVIAKCNDALVNPQIQCWVTVKDETVTGMMAGQVFEYEFGQSLIASDILVFVSPEHRGGTAFLRLVKEYIEWSKSLGAELIFLNQTTGVNQEATGKLYQRIGFDPVGGMYVMIIGKQSMRTKQC